MVHGIPVRLGHEYIVWVCFGRSEGTFQVENATLTILEVVFLLDTSPTKFWFRPYTTEPEYLWSVDRSGNQNDLLGFLQGLLVFPFSVWNKFHAVDGPFLPFRCNNCLYQNLVRTARVVISRVWLFSPDRVNGVLAPGTLLLPPFWTERPTSR